MHVHTQLKTIRPPELKTAPLIKYSSFKFLLVLILVSCFQQFIQQQQVHPAASITLACEQALHLGYSVRWLRQFVLGAWAKLRDLGKQGKGEPAMVFVQFENLCSCRF